MLEPREEEEIELSLRAGIYSQGGINAFHPGDFAGSSARANAHVFAEVEARHQVLFEAFGLNCFGADLDERVAQLPGMVGRLSRRAASGSVLQITRQSSVGDVTYPAGTLLFGRKDGGSTYRNSADITFLDGVSVYPSVGGTLAGVIATAFGTDGNCSAGEIDQIIEGDGLRSVTNIQPLTNGRGRESDFELKVRALDYMRSLARCQKSALEYLGKTFQTLDGRGARFCFVVEDPTKSYVELIVDDGLGFADDIRTGIVHTGTVAEGQDLFWFDSPGAYDEVIFSLNGERIYDVQWTTIAERGVAYILPESVDSLWTEGDTWSAQPAHVYTGFIAELQAIIEGSASAPGLLPGWRASGVRVRVRPPRLQYTPFDILVVAEDDYDLDKVEARVRDGVMAFMQSLPPGEPLLVQFDLSAAIHQIDGVKNAKFRNPGNTDEAAADAYPHTRFTKLSTKPDKIKVNGR